MYPTGVAVDAYGDLFIADPGTNTIREVGAKGIITTVAGDGISGYSGDGVVDDEGTLGPRPQVVGLIDSAGQFAGQAPPIDVLTAQEIVEHADLAGQNLAQLGAEAVEGFDL